MLGIALGVGAQLFAGSEGSGRLGAIASILIEVTTLNALDPHASLTNVLDRIADHKITPIDKITS